MLDVRDPADRALLGTVIERADAFVQNLIPGAAAARPRRAEFGGG